MRFEKEVRDQYLTYSTLGNRVAAKLSLYAKQPVLPELCDLLGTRRITNTESLGVIEIPVSKIVGNCSTQSLSTFRFAEGAFASYIREQK